MGWGSPVAMDWKPCKIMRVASSLLMTQSYLPAKHTHLQSSRQGHRDLKQCCQTCERRLGRAGTCRHCCRS